MSRAETMSTLKVPVAWGPFTPNIDFILAKELFLNYNCFSF